MSMLQYVVLAALLAAGSFGAATNKPHILFILVDDWGWNNVGYHRQRYNNGTLDAEIKTPTFDSLVRSGIELNRHYTYNFCSPTRSSLQSGRLPVHSVVQNINPISINPDDPVSGMSGLPRNITGLASKLKEGGYRTAFTGKWDCGMAIYEQTPLGRGYETFFGYFHHANDYYTQTLSLGSTVGGDLCQKNGYELVDLWDTDKPASSKNGTLWEEYLFTENTLKVIRDHNVEEPLFLFHAFHIVHTPLQVPEDLQTNFRFLRNNDRRHYASMVNYADYAVGLFKSELERKGMYENTLVLVSSDNGGPIYGGGAGFGKVSVYGAATNLPLRGGKVSDWEGGIRVNAFVSGGAVPVKQRGTRLDEYIHISDWYRTLCAIAGVDAEDKRAAEADLPPVDGFNMWPLLSGEVKESPRKEIHISRKTLIQGKYKLLTGSDLAIFQLYPEKYMMFDVHNVGYGWGAMLNTRKGRDCEAGCLFDIFADPNEDHQITNEPEIVDKMMQRLNELNKGNFNPNRGKQSMLACKYGMEKCGGFYCPFAEDVFQDPTEFLQLLVEPESLEDLSNDTDTFLSRLLLS